MDRDTTDTTEAAHPDGVLLVRRITTRAVLAVVLGNTVATVVIVTLLAVVLPIPDGARLIEPLTIVLTPVYGAAALTAGVVLGVRSSNRRLAWLAAGRTPTPTERRRTLSIPWTVTKLQASLWALSAVLFAGLQVADSMLLAIEVGLAVLIGGLASSAWTRLLVEVTNRPAVAAALRDAPVRTTTPGTGITLRAVVAWLLGTGLPLAGLVTLAALAVPTGIDRDELALSAAVLGAVAFASGIAVTLLAARTVAHPLRTLRRAVERLDAGEREVTVEVTDAGEVGVLQTAFNQLSQGLTERDQLRDLFGRHVGEGVARRALAEGVELGGEVRDVTVLFADVAGSTALAERSDPHQVVARLNHLFGLVVREVEAETGTLTTFAGDAAVCVWGAPTHHPAPAEAALRAARRLAEALRDDPDALPVGIGVASGHVLAGNIGSRDRLAYTVIGDAVNTAARLSDLAKRRDVTVLADRRVVALAEDERPRWSPAGEAVLRGRSEHTLLAMPVADRVTTRPDGTRTAT